MYVQFLYVTKILSSLNLTISLLYHAVFTNILNPVIVNLLPVKLVKLCMVN